MKKLVSGLAAAAILSVGFVGVEATAAAASPAGISAPSSVSALAFDEYGPTKADFKQTRQAIKNAIKSNNLTPAKARKLKDKLRDYYDAGLINKAQYRQLIRKINKNVN